MEHDLELISPILEIVDRTIQYFQDRTDIWIGNISRILENVADSDFQYFQAGNNYF